MFLILINSCIWFSLLLLTAKILSSLEKRFIKASGKVLLCKIPWSLHFFKISRTILFMFASFEAALFPHDNIGLRIFGLFLVIVGVYLRIASISALGELWSYHVCLKNHHSIVRSGIYRYLSHPSYVGNIHILGLTLILCANFSSVLALIFIIVFYYIRVSEENNLLSTLSDSANA